MKNSAVAASLLSASALISPAWAVVKLPITRRADYHPDIVAAHNIFARTPISESLLNNKTLYQASVTIGTPAQTFSLDIDTGSSDVYIIATDADQCSSASVQDASGGGCFGGTFDITKSSTANIVGKGTFQVSYGDKTGASGDFITDAFAVGGSTIKDLIMGLAHKTTTGSGLIGVGYDVNEAIVQSGSSTRPYPSIIDTMLNQSLISTKTYSLYLDDLAASSGTILFGGADTGKFIGQLKSVPFLTDASQGINREFLVSLTGISLTNQSGVNTALTTSTFQLPVLLDSGTTLCYLPSAVVSEFVSIFQAVSTSGVYVVDCAFRNAQSKGFIAFSFGNNGPVINVPIAELVVPITGTDKCRLGMKGQDSGPYILGDTFLRSAYVVFDLTNNVGALAQANFDSTVSTIVEIKPSDSGIPTLTGQATGTSQEPGVSSKSAAGTVAPFQTSAVVVLALASTLSLLGGMLFLA